MFGAVVNVIFVAFVDLDGGVLGVNLAFDKRLENLGDPDIEADLAAGGDNLERKMFLDTTGVFELVFVTQDAVERGKELLGGELLFVVGTRDF